MVYRIAILFEAVQLSDVVGADLFGNASRACMDMIARDTGNEFAVPELIKSQAIDMEFLYVSSTMEPAYSTPDFKITPTHTFESCPRDVDVILIGGPMLSHRPEGSLQLFKDFFAGKGKKGVVFMTTCTGGMWVAEAGVLKGKKATTNRMFLQQAAKLYPGVQWEDRRWVVDEMDGGIGEIWTSGGAQCGIDMISAFVEQKFPHPLGTFARLGLDVDHHVLGQDYKEPVEKTFAKMAVAN